MHIQVMHLICSHLKCIHLGGLFLVLFKDQQVIEQWLGPTNKLKLECIQEGGRETQRINYYKVVQKNESKCKEFEKVTWNTKLN